MKTKTMEKNEYKALLFAIVDMAKTKIYNKLQPGDYWIQHLIDDIKDTAAEDFSCIHRSMEKQTTTSDEGLMSVPEFAERVLRCSQTMGWRLAKEGAFPVIRNGRLVRVEPKKALAAYVAKFKPKTKMKTEKEEGQS